MQKKKFRHSNKGRTVKVRENGLTYGVRKDGGLDMRYKDSRVLSEQVITLGGMTANYADIGTTPKVKKSTSSLRTTHYYPRGYKVEVAMAKRELFLYRALWGLAWGVLVAFVYILATGRL